MSSLGLWNLRCTFRNRFTFRNIRAPVAVLSEMNSDQVAALARCEEKKMCAWLYPEALDLEIFGCCGVAKRDDK